MRIARSVSPRRRNRLSSAKCSSTVSGSTLTTSMKASIALSGCSFSRKLSPRKYERGRRRDSESNCLMSTRAASQPRPKNSANPNSHHSSKLRLKSTPGSGLRRRGAIPGAQRAGELLDLAALPEHPRHAGEDADCRAEREEQEQREDHRHLPGLPEEQAQAHGLGVHQREGEDHEEQERSQHPGQLSDESHQSKTAAPCRCRRSNTAGPNLLFLVHPLAQFLACL